MIQLKIEKKKELNNNHSLTLDIKKKSMLILFKQWSVNYIEIMLHLLQDQNAGKMFADEAAAIYERAITTLMKSNMLLFFAYADFEEVC